MTDQNPTLAAARLLDLRRRVAPLESLRRTFASRAERAAPTVPDSQFEFLPRRSALPAL